MLSGPMRRERPVGKIVDVFELPDEKFFCLCEEKDTSVKSLMYLSYPMRKMLSVPIRRERPVSITVD